ncbi:hypothetical protein [Niabella ginsengisoli]|uniref:Uncharacterized protein n=1 Tax=Niabella ginsengisoli TaxID=522298 RepID=A0ABS9SK58_9BACT|nr:hypothetical protein [Niabella ginsengisoli]MCH5598767.1 hypothetical protein [Niabella ginsengisoli]
MMDRFSSYKAKPLCVSFSFGEGLRVRLSPASVLLLSFTCVALLFCGASISNAQTSGVRSVINLNNNWHTIAGNDENPIGAAFQMGVDESAWKQVSVPHNWDDYYGYRRLLHGNKHGDAWYRKKISVKQSKNGKRFFFFF